MPAIHVSVLAAFLETGSRNAWTPLAIASTPVMAAQPDANARISRKSVNVCTGSIGVLGRGNREGLSPLGERHEDPEEDHEDDQADEREGRPGEQRSRTP